MKRRKIRKQREEKKMEKIHNIFFKKDRKIQAETKYKTMQKDSQKFG